MIKYTKEYTEVIEQGGMASYTKLYGEDIHINGTVTLVYYDHEDKEDSVLLNLDFADDYETPHFLVLNFKTEDLLIYDDFQSAFADFKERVDELENEG